MKYTLYQLEEVYTKYRSMNKAGESLGLSKSQFRQQYLKVQGLCINCKNKIDKDGLICSYCLYWQRKKIQLKLPKYKICKQCDCKMKRDPWHTNGGWGKIKICDTCEINNGRECIRNHYSKIENKKKKLEQSKNQKDYQVKYRKSKLGKFRRQTSESKRRALKRSTSEHNIDKYIFKLLTSRKYCEYCGIKDKLAIDHIIPLSRSGCHKIDNIAIVCKVCNSRKGTKNKKEYFEYLREIA